MNEQESRRLPPQPAIISAFMPGLVPDFVVVVVVGVVININYTMITILKNGRSQNLTFFGQEHIYMQENGRG